MKIVLPVLSSVFLAFFAACHFSENEPAFSRHFQKPPLADTLRFEVSQGEGEPPGDTIPNAQFFTQIPAPLVQGIEYLGDAGEAKIIGRSRFPLHDNVEAYLVDIRQNWFQHQSIFLFDQKSKTFTARIPVAEWHGGDGGQILTGSWLFDCDGDGGKDLVRREIEHWMVLDGDEPRDAFVERAALLLWQNGQFVETAVKDTAALVKACPIKTMW